MKHFNKLKEKLTKDASCMKLVVLQANIHTMLTEDLVNLKRKIELILLDREIDQTMDSFEMTEIGEIK